MGSLGSRDASVEGGSNRLGCRTSLLAADNWCLGPSALFDDVSPSDDDGSFLSQTRHLRPDVDVIVLHVLKRGGTVY